jgi:hypothetical protein
MGTNILDQYSLLHFASGIVAYFFGIGFVKWNVMHGTFEILENTEMGMNIINNNFTFWPGGKPYPDSFVNSMIGDNLSSAVGWKFAEYVDNVGNERGWYSPHIV